jgi:hypothetical protein
MGTVKIFPHYELLDAAIFPIIELHDASINKF